MGSDEERDKEAVLNEEKYQRKAGGSVKVDAIKNKKLKQKLKRHDRQAQDAAKSAARAEILLHEEAGYLEPEGIEKTYSYRQDQLQKAVDINTANKIFSLDLPEFGPYTVDYTRNGRHLLIGGKKGHLAAFDWQTSKLHFETHVNEIVRDVKWLHNETMLAVAQKKYVYIYDHSGAEIHRLKNHIEVNKLEFLPYHFLLASVGNAGYLKYQDTSTGQVVSELRTKLGPCHTMAQNPWNAVIHLGHIKGTVTLWAPTMSTPLVKILCHRGPVEAVAVDQSGRYMATSGLDGKMKVWDIRMFKEMDSYYCKRPATSLSISQRGLLALGCGNHVTIWKDAFRTKQKSPYMHHLQPGAAIQDLEFCPYEDVLGVGHHDGLSSLVVPGAGEPNFDSLEANPYQTKKQRQESEVHHLLDKLQPGMISLNPNDIGQAAPTLRSNMQKRPFDDKEEEEEEEEDENGVQEDDGQNKGLAPAEIKARAIKKEQSGRQMRGKGKSLKHHMRKKRANVIDERRKRVEGLLAKDRDSRQHDNDQDKSFTALDIF